MFEVEFVADEEYDPHRATELHDHLFTNEDLTLTLTCQEWSGTPKDPDSKHLD